MNLDSMVFEVTTVPTVTQSLQRVSDLLNQLKIIQLFEGLALPGLILDFFSWFIVYIIIAKYWQW